MGLVKLKHILPVILMLLLAVTRWPGLLPWNFSAVYGLMFCAGVYFPKKLAWWLPLVTIFITDMLLNWYYHVHYQTPFFSLELIGNYIAYLALIWLGRRFTSKAPFVALVAGGLLGAVLFYLVTNTFSWFFNTFNSPEYTKTFTGWIIALTRGTAGWPQTWEFFRNNLLSGGLFTALFAGAMKLSEAAEPAEDREPAEEKEEETPTQPEEVKA